MPSLICGGAIFSGALYLFSFGTLCLDNQLITTGRRSGKQKLCVLFFSDIVFPVINRAYPIEIVSCQQRQISVCDAGRSDAICLRLEKKKSCM